MSKIDLIKLIKINAVGFSIGDKDPNNVVRYQRLHYDLATIWLAFSSRIKTLNRAYTSQQLTTLAISELEKYLYTKHDIYISNGALIAAAIDFGFTVKRCPSPQHRNAWLNIGSTRQFDRPISFDKAVEIAKQLKEEQKTKSIEIKKQLSIEQKEKEQKQLREKQHKERLKQWREEEKKAAQKLIKEQLKKRKYQEYLKKFHAA